MYARTIEVKKENDYYGVKLFIGLVVLVFILAYTSLYAIQNYYSNSFFSSSNSNKKMYVLHSDTLRAMYEKKDMDYDAYINRLKSLEAWTDDFGFDSKDIESAALNTISKNSILLVIDMMSLSQGEINNIDSFVQRGGSVIFNFTSGFLNESFKYQEKNLVSTIAGLNLSKAHNTISFQKKNEMYMSTRLLSPVTQYLTDGHALGMSLYDPIPIYHTNRKADAYLTNWSQTHYAQITKGKELSSKESGIAWHGSKGKGKWVYFSFPSYVLTEKEAGNYKKFFHGALSYLDNKIHVQLYPYIDTKSAVFISEDTEYKFENLQHFAQMAKKHHFPVTVFCVGNLALKYKSLMYAIGKSPFVEIGSHSFMHKKIVGESDEVYEREIFGSKKALNVFSKKDVVGFRAPREELDGKMLDLLEDAQFKYVLDAGDNRLYPYFKKKMLMIPRHATDDYSYLINLDWSSAQILREMKKEVQNIYALDGLYTLSTHTHLMNFGSNIKIVDKFMSYVNKDKNLTPLNGRMIYERVSSFLHLSVRSSMTKKHLMLTISNDNPSSVHDVHYEIETEPGVKIKSVDSEMIGLKTTLTKKSDGTYLLVVKSLKPKSQIVLFLKYVQNN